MQISLHPLPDGLPDFHTALRNLGRVPATLYQGLEHAAFRTCSFRDVESPGERLDGGLSASIFRFHAIRFLRKEGINAEADEFTWTFDRLPFMGISFYYEQNHVRVLKGPKGFLPGCGSSRKKSRFYAQWQSMYLIGNKPMRTKANMVVLWDFDIQYGLSKLWLALPANGGRRPQDVSAYWCEPIPHPADSFGGGTVPPSPPPDDLDGLIQRESPHETKRKKSGQYEG
jgi:hypothetical protein